MIELRQSTAYIARLGPFVNSTGVTPVTNLTIDGADEAEVLKFGTTGTQAIAGTLTAIANCDGYYYMTITASETSALGDLILAINDDSAILPFRETYAVVESNYWDTKYNSTGSFKSSLTAATYTTVTSFHANVTGYSTFDPAVTGVTLASAAYTSIGAFRATGFSTFDPAVTGVTLAGAVYASIGSFKADVTGLSTFDPATDGVTLASAAYASIGAFKADVSGTLKASLTSATYTSADDFKATGFSTFDPAAIGVTLASAAYASIGAFRLAVSDIIAGISDGAYDLQEMMRLIFAAVCCKVSGGSTTTITFRNSADDTNRIVATVDANGNRTAVTFNAS